MKKLIISIIAIVIIVGLAYILKDLIVLDSMANEDRFIKIDNYDCGYIAYDKQTKVEYAVSTGSYNRGTITLLVDQEGKPLLYKESE